MQILKFQFDDSEEDTIEKDDRKGTFDKFRNTQWEPTTKMQKLELEKK